MGGKSSKLTIANSTPNDITISVEGSKEEWEITAKGKQTLDVARGKRIVARAHSGANANRKASAANGTECSFTASEEHCRFMLGLKRGSEGSSWSLCKLDYFDEEVADGLIWTDAVKDAEESNEAYIRSGGRFGPDEVGSDRYSAAHERNDQNDAKQANVGRAVDAKDAIASRSNTTGATGKSVTNFVASAEHAGKDSALLADTIFEQVNAKDFKQGMGPPSLESGLCEPGSGSPASVFAD